MGGAQDDEDKEAGQKHFDDQCRGQRVTARRMFTVTVGGKAAELEISLAAGNQIQGRSCDDAPCNLGDDVTGKRGGRKFAGNREPYRDGRIEVTARDAADRIGHCQHVETKGKRDAEQANADFRKSCGENCATAAAEHKPECS
jgi:hypothetical protein